MSIKQAIEALDKATPQPWAMRGDSCHYGTITEIYSGEVIIAETNREADTPLIAAAPEMAAWIKEALPMLENYYETFAFSGDADADKILPKLEELIKKGNQ